MRRTSVALVVLTAGLTASAALRRVVARRRAAGSPAAVPSVAPVASVAAPLPATTVEKAVPSDDAVVLPFTRRGGSVPAAQPLGAVRCGDTGGRTKAGAPCAARGTANGRCHHHRVAA
jgi:hypothetical protein